MTALSISSAEAAVAITVILVAAALVCLIAWKTLDAGRDAARRDREQQR